MNQAARNADAGRYSLALSVLKQAFGDQLQTGEAICGQHAHTTTWIAPEPPDAVLFARSTEDVAHAVAIAAEHALPVIAFGTGSSLEGHVNAPLGGLSIDLSQMNRVLAVHAEDLDAVVEAGVTRTQLNSFLRDTGLFFPIDPGADASLGGMAATRASGTNAVRYGTMKDVVLSLKAVMADGTVITAGRRVKKSSAGYDLARLLVGSEGTLGIITELTVRLSGIPEAIGGGVISFPTIEAAAEAVIATIQCAIPVARIELLDALQIKACNAYSGLDLPETPHLFVEFHGTPAGVDEQAALFGAIAEDCGAAPLVWSSDPEARTKLWQARHDAYWAALQLRPGAKGVSTDVCVPISRLAECIAETRADIEASALQAPIVGHAGDGNFHVLILVDMEDADEVARAKAFVSRLNQRAIAMDGTATGEHGIGQGKRPYMQAEHGAALTVMGAIKKALDPQNILNPGKILPEDVA
ncbi:MAG: FAD-binding protein [Hyphomicrobiaceae bacterium]|nr:FAD-binding protein [Hyphomicrobiaceae bacterium]